MGITSTHYGIDPSTQAAKGDAPDRDDVKAWARREARKALNMIRDDFEKEMAWHGNFDRSALESEFDDLVDAIENASWDIVRRSEQ